VAADHAVPPTTEYAKSGDVHVAYQVLGDGPPNLVFVPGFVSHVEHFWEDPALARFLRRLASFSRLVFFDKRGTGLSDRVSEAAVSTVAMPTSRRVDPLIAEAVALRRRAANFVEGRRTTATRRTIQGRDSQGPRCESTLFTTSVQIRLGAHGLRVRPALHQKAMPGRI
jgi:hypothetical protein